MTVRAIGFGSLDRIARVRSVNTACFRGAQASRVGEGRDVGEGALKTRRVAPGRRIGVVLAVAVPLGDAPVQHLGGPRGLRE
jgi:hypothetical protein